MALTPGFQIPFGIQPLNPIPTDSWSGPYSGSTSAEAKTTANSSIPASARFQSMEVRLIVDGVAKKYWYKNGTTDSDLVEFLDESKLPLAGGTLTGNLTGTNATFTSSVSAPALSGVHYGDGSNLTGVIKTQYSLPTASNSVLGGVKVDGSTITIDANGIISGSSQYTPPANATFTSSVSAPALSGVHYGDGSNLTGVIKTQYTPPADATFTSSVSAPAVRGVFYGDGSNLTGISTGGTGVDATKLPLSGGTVTGNLTVTGNFSATGTTTFIGNTVFTSTSSLSIVNVSPSDIPALYIGQSGTGDIASFYDVDLGIEVLHIGGANGSNPNVGIKTSAPNKDLTVKGEISATGDVTTSGKYYGDGSSLTGVIKTQYTPPADATFTSSISAPAVRGMFYGDGSNLTGIVSPIGSYLPLSGGVVSGAIYFNSNSGLYGARIEQGNLDTNRGGAKGVSLVCSVDYDFNWQAGWITALEQDRTTPRPLYIDSGVGTSIRSWSTSGSGVEITHEGIVFPNGSIQNIAAEPPIGSTPVFESVTTDIVTTDVVTTDVVTTGTVLVGETMKALDNHWGTKIAFYSNQVSNIVNADENTYSVIISMQKYNSTDANGDTIYLRVINGISPNAGDTIYNSKPLISVVTIGDEDAQLLKTKCVSAVNASGHFIAVSDTGEVNSFRVYQTLPGVGYGLPKNIGMGWFDGMESTPFNYNGSFVLAKKLIFPDGSAQTTAPSETTTPTFDNVTTGGLFVGDTLSVLNNYWGTEIEFSTTGNNLNNLVNITDPYTNTSDIQLTKFSSTNGLGITIYFRVRNGSSSDAGNLIYSYNMNSYPLITVVTVGDETAQILKTKCVSAINASGHFIAVDDTGEANSFSVYQNQAGVGENLTATVMNGMAYFDYARTSNFTKNNSFVLAKNLLATVSLASLEDNSGSIASTAWVKAQNYTTLGENSTATVRKLEISNVALLEKGYPFTVLTFDPAQINSLRQGGYYFSISLEDENSVGRAIAFQSDYNTSSNQANPIVVYSDPENETIQSLKTKSISSINASGYFTAEDYSPYEIKVTKKGFGGSTTVNSGYNNSFFAVPSATNFNSFDAISKIAQLSATVKPVSLEDNSANIASTSWVKSQNYIGGAAPIFTSLTITDTLTAGMAYPKATITLPPFELDQYGGDWRNSINVQYYDLLLQGPNDTYRLGWRTSADSFGICVTNDGDADTYQDFITLTVAAINAHGVFTAEASTTDPRSFYVYQKTKTATAYTVALYNSGYGSGFWTAPNASFTNFLISYSIVPDPGATFNVPFAPPANATFTSSVSAPALSGSFYGGDFYGVNATLTSSVSAPALSGSFYGDGSGVTGIKSENVVTSVMVIDSANDGAPYGVGTGSFATCKLFHVYTNYTNRIIKVDSNSQPCIFNLYPEYSGGLTQIGDQIIFVNVGTNPIGFITSGASIISKGDATVLPSKGSVATLMYMGGNEYILAGGISGTV